MKHLYHLLESRLRLQHIALKSIFGGLFVLNVILHFVCSVDVYCHILEGLLEGFCIFQLDYGRLCYR